MWEPQGSVVSLVSTFIAEIVGEIVKSENYPKSRTVEANVFMHVEEEKTLGAHAQSIQILEGNIIREETDGYFQRAEL